MRWTKVALVVAGGLVVFFVVNTVVHVILGLLTALAFVAIVAGGVAIAVKIAAAKKHREVSRKHKDYEVKDDPAKHVVLAPPPMPPTPASSRKADVDDELARLKREMGA